MRPVDYTFSFFFYHCFHTAPNCTETWRFALHLLSLSICQRSLRTIHNSQFIIHNYRIETSLSGSGNPRAWTSVPGRFPSFLYLYIYIYRDRRIAAHANTCRANRAGPYDVRPRYNIFRKEVFLVNLEHSFFILQKGGVPAAPSGTATLLRLSPNHQFCLRPILAVTDFRHPRLSWLDGRCVQGPGTYSPRHG